MRSKVVLLASLVGCATPNTGRVCKPASSWASPAYHCEMVAAAVAPAPEPTPPPPEPPPPAKVEVSAATIDLKEKVEFDIDSTAILDKSKPLLDEVVRVMHDHPEIVKIEVQGHTDSQGAHDHNVKLSDGRAASVRKYLQDAGIAAKRMVSRGYGPDKPIANNGTEEGRAENRRVEIHILERAP